MVVSMSNSWTYLGSERHWLSWFDNRRAARRLRSWGDLVHLGPKRRHSPTHSDVRKRHQLHVGDRHLSNQRTQVSKS